MSRKATCLDNAPAESFFHILKVGTVHNNYYDSYQEVKIAVTAYIEYYNQRRIRTKPAGMTPVEYREQCQPVNSLEIHSNYWGSLQRRKKVLLFYTSGGATTYKKRNGGKQKWNVKN